MDNKILIIDLIENKECKRFTYSDISVDECLSIIKGYMETNKPLQVSWVSKSEHKEIMGDFSDDILSEANIKPLHYQ